MLKKALSSIVLSSSLLLSNNLNLNLMNSFAGKTSWNISMSKNATYYLMLPMDVDYTTLQNSITDSNAAIWVYRWYQRSDLVNADFGVNVLGVVMVKKNQITYYIQDNGSWISKTNYADFKTYLENVANDITDSSKKSIFLNSYIPSFNKINANKLYLLMPSEMDLNINIALPTSSDSNSTGTTPNDGIERPPAPPSI